MSVRKIIEIIVIGVMIMSTIGCDVLVSHEEQAVRLLNEKYKDSFVIEEVQSQSFSGGYYTVIAYQEDNADVLFRADVNSDGTGLSDNYVAKQLCWDMADQVARNLNDLEGTYYIYIELMFEPDMLSKPGITLKEFMRETPNNRFTINVNYAPDGTNPEAVYAGLSNILNEMESITGKIHLYLMDESNIAHVQEYMETHDRCYDEFEDWAELYSAGIIDFEDGKIVTTKEEIIKMLEKKL